MEQRLCENSFLQKGMMYEPNNSELMDGIQRVSRQVSFFENQMQTGMNEVIKKVDTVTRKKRKLRVSRQIVTLEDGTITMVDRFDDGTNAMCPLILNLFGGWQVYKVYVEETTEKIFWGILFQPNRPVWIIGEYEKVNASNLYEMFIKTGIIFNSQISRTLIRELLFETFAPLIEQSESTLTISQLAGWWNGEYIHAENFPFSRIGPFGKFPIMWKRFEIVKPQEGGWNAYFSEMKRVQKWEDRLMITLFPYAGILSSLMLEQNCVWNLVLNFICLDNFPISQICAWLQVFNRENLCPITINTDTTERNWEKRLAEYKDEVLLVNSCVQDNRTFYSDKKSLSRRQKVIQRIRLLGNRKGGIQAALAVISNDFCPGDNVYNILLERTAYEYSPSIYDPIQEGKVMESVWTCFVSYIKNHMEDVWRKMRRKKAENLKGAYALEMVFDIVRGFWKEEGLDFCEALQIPEKVNFDWIMECNCYDEEELTVLFIKCVREAISHITFLPKNHKSNKHDAIRYDDCYLWIPRSVLKDMISTMGLERYIPKILFKLKEKRVLKTDSEGLTRKLQINGDRCEYYQLVRSFFNAEGLVDIVHLGKERDEYDG